MTIKDNYRYIDVHITDSTSSNYNSYMFAITPISHSIYDSSNNSIFVFTGDQVLKVMDNPTDETIVAEQNVTISYDDFMINKFTADTRVVNIVHGNPDYTFSVIPFVQLTDSLTTSGHVFEGNITVMRANSDSYDNCIYLPKFIINDPYAKSFTPSIKMEYFGRSGNVVNGCKFKYNDKWYGGLLIGFISANAHIYINGMALNKSVEYNLCSQMINYYNRNTHTVLNQEIYDSIQVVQDNNVVVNTTYLNRYASNVSFLDAEGQTANTLLSHYLDNSFNIGEYQDRTMTNKVFTTAGGQEYYCIVSRRNANYWSVLSLGFTETDGIKKYTYSNGIRSIASIKIGSLNTSIQ